MEKKLFEKIVGRTFWGDKATVKRKPDEVAFVYTPEGSEPKLMATLRSWGYCWDESAGHESSELIGTENRHPKLFVLGAGRKVLNFIRPDLCSMDTQDQLLASSIHAGTLIGKTEEEAAIKLWKEYGAVPTNYVGEQEKPWLHFPEGTHWGIVWSWINGMFSEKVSRLHQTHPEPESVEVSTPAGRLIATTRPDDEYPGIEIEVESPDGKRTLIALIEHIPGGECVDDKMITSGRIQMGRITSKTEPNGWKHSVLTPGFMARIYQSENSDEPSSVSILTDENPIET